MIQIGHYESRVETLLQSLGLDDHAPLFAPGLCRVTRLVKQANFHISRLILCLDLLHQSVRVAFKNLVA